MSGDYLPRTAVAAAERSDRENDHLAALLAWLRAAGMCALNAVGAFNRAHKTGARVIFWTLGKDRDARQGLTLGPAMINTKGMPVVAIRDCSRSEPIDYSDVSLHNVLAIGGPEQ